MAKREINNKVSIFLIKDGTDKEELFKDNLNLCELCSSDTSKTYYTPTIINTPKWIRSYYGLDYVDHINVSNSKVISIHELEIDGKKILFAIPFGSGKSLLNEEVIEEQFGIKVLLNTVKVDEFRQLVSSNYGGDHRTRNEQVPKKTNINEFGFDIFNDFIRKATAKCEDDLFNKNTIVGGDLLTVTVPVNYSNIDEFLVNCYKRYKLDKYKDNFSWLDNIKEVKEKSKKEKLDEKMIEMLKNEEYEKIWAAVPELIEWENVREFKYNKNDVGKDDIEIKDIVSQFKLQDSMKVDSLKRKKVYAISTESDDSIYDWSLYNCLIGEIELDNKMYCLNFGKWYVLDNDFVGETNEYYENILLVDYDFPDNNNSREDEYNSLLNTNLKDSILMDKETVRLDGMGKSSIEVCDVFSSNNELIHIKKNGGSSYLSHLFNQASVSAEMLLDESFRKKVNSKFKKEIFDNDFNAKNYTVIMGIITNKNEKRPSIPFFSKVSIRYAIDGLKRKGYNVKLANIFNKK